MMSLFSSFDFFVFYFYPILFFSFLFFWCTFWISSSFNFYFCLISFFILNYLSSLTFWKYKFQDIAMTLLFFTFLILNLVSIFSYYFSITTQVSFNFSISLMLWISFIIMSCRHNFMNFLLHLIPEGSPLFLSFFLFLIELVSSLIRPLTLMIRLTANILAGHILLILCCKVALIFPYFSFILGLLNFVEIFVSLIQSYIFMSLSCMYLSDLS